MWRIQWLRRFIRRRMKPIPIDRAQLWEQRLSIAYMFFAWNAFGIVCYMMYTGRSDWAKYHGLKDEMDDHLTPAQQWARTLNIQNARIVRVSGLTVQPDESDAEK
ncbi:hypothetical protein J437_LFUL009317 [Ladona fulva]|uniref:Uncharacterized protein n=1 Tax=Ladona fulva TaxID=123851 RepID=A0A8K0K6G1_LADFU|nr:hypothetical protein J437_LFUL009317 [Ladona fulva]